MKGPQDLANAPNSAPRVVFLGSYDRGKPRVRNLLEGARRAGIDIIECNADIWSNVEDKSRLGTLRLRLRYLFRWLTAQPKLIFNYCRTPRHAAVIFPYPGVIDVLIFYPFTRTRRVSTLLDSFISVYDTVVNDRRLLAPAHPFARAIYWLERLAARTVDTVFLDTPVHARYFEKLFDLPLSSVESVAVGVEEQIFKRRLYQPWQGNRPLEVLFFGQFIPLQGALPIVEAIRLSQISQNLELNWTIIGEGQESLDFDTRMAECQLDSVKRLRWVPYNQLPDYIAAADICLGIFGTSKKASVVIPNKVYQTLAIGRPLLTASTSGIRSLPSLSSAIELVKPGDPSAILEGLEKLASRIKNSPLEVQSGIASMPIIGSGQVGVELKRVLRTASRKNKSKDYN